MPQIYTIGETVLDILFKDNNPVAAKAGGSMLNTAVSLGRLGLPVHFISEYGDDQTGRLIDHFLTSNGVDTRLVYRYNEGKSALALAFLDENNNADYSFYKAYPAKRLAIQFPEIVRGDIIMFGSFYGISNEIRPVLKEFLLGALNKEAVIVYDPNFRKSHLFELEKLRPVILENMSYATLVRCSDEDLQLIFQVNDHHAAYEKVKSYCPNLIYTSGSRSVYLHTGKIQKSYPVNKIEPVSTIGAGDSFNAGLIYGIHTRSLEIMGIEGLKSQDWKELISVGMEFASQVCQSYDNYISEEFAHKYK